MKKVVFCLLFILSNIGSVFSQFDAQQSLYMFHNSFFNPAAVGEGDMIQATIEWKNQWMGMPNAGSTFFISVNSPLKVLNSNHGVGVKILDDNIGLFTNQSIHLQYAYKKRIGEGVFSAGADLGEVSLGFRGDSVRPVSVGEYHKDIPNDLSIPKTVVNGTSFDMSLGAYYSTPTYYAGVSVMHLNSPIVNWDDRTDFKINSTFFITGGYNWVLPDSKYVFKPSTLIKTNFSSLQMDLTARMEYDSKYWAGLTYRFGELGFLAGLNLANGLTIAASYDLPTSQVITVSGGSLEFVAIYSFEYVFGNRKSKYKSIRIL